MQPLRAPSREPPVAWRERRPIGPGRAFGWGTAVAVDRVGYLVPAAYFDGAVHSVFARACNFACGDSLLTLVARDRADGPTTLRLGLGAPPDLRLHFRPGERVRCRDGIAAAPGVTMRLTGAAIWHPVRPPPLATATQLAANLRFAAAALARRRRTHSSVIDREGSAVLAGLGAACRALDAGTAAHEVERLIGWGEGLTPAGDDVLVGWRAALDALVDGEPGRAAFLRAVVGRDRDGELPGRRRSPRIACASPRGGTTTPM